MLKRHNIKSKSFGISPHSLSDFSGKISCLLLLFLTLLLINPTTTSASALGVEEASNDDTNYDNRISTQADSGVTISFAPSSGSASLTPTTVDGASAKVDVSANVKIASTGGYTIYLGGQNSALTGSKTGQTIPGATSATTFANMATNTWGYAVAEGSSVPDSATYSALPQGQGKSLASVSGNDTNVDRTFAISFATKIGNDKPADTYSNQVTLSVTTSPLQLSLTSISDMQQMTSAICEQSTVGDTKQLIDTRDNKKYWVKKMSDGKCWMVQDLKLDLGTIWPAADKSDYTTASTSYTPTKTSTSITLSTTENSYTTTEYTQTLSWDLGNYVISNPSASSDCGSGKSSLADCSNQFTNVAGKTASSDPDFYKNHNNQTVVGNEYDAHYLVGNYYFWNTATAGTGGTMSTGEAAGSICPKGWRLPYASNFASLTNSITLETAINEYFIVRGGSIGARSGLNKPGYQGYLWSSTAYNGGYAGHPGDFFFAQRLWAYADSGFTYYYGERIMGYEVRCIAR